MIMAREKETPPSGKMFYSITEVSRMLGVSPSTLRYWEHELPSVNPGRSSGGTRKYTAVDIEELRIIQRLVKQEGLTIEGVKKKLQRNRYGEMKKQDAIARLRSIRDELKAIIRELDKIHPSG